MLEILSIKEKAEALNVVISKFLNQTDNLNSLISLLEKRKNELHEEIKIITAKLEALDASFKEENSRKLVALDSSLASAKAKEKELESLCRETDRRNEGLQTLTKNQEIMIVNATLEKSRYEKMRADYEDRLQKIKAATA